LKRLNLLWELKLRLWLRLQRVLLLLMWAIATAKGVNLRLVHLPKDTLLHWHIRGPA
jgi:hypothetical protein